MKTCTYVCCVNVAHLGSYLKSPCYPKSTPLYLRRAVVRLKKEGDVDTRSPSSRLYRLITHKFKVTRGTSLRSVKTRGTDLTSVCPPHHNHTRENLPGAPPHFGVDTFTFKTRSCTSQKREG